MILGEWRRQMEDVLDFTQDLVECVNNDTKVSRVCHQELDKLTSSSAALPWHLFHKCLLLPTVPMYVLFNLCVL